MTEPDPFASVGDGADGYDPDKFYVDPIHGILRYRNGSWAGKPCLPHPETGKLVAWGRPSSLGKPLDDGTSLGNWRLVKTAEGMTARADLRYRMADCDPTDGADFVRKLAIANDAIDAAGGADGRTRGTALHTITERLDRGERVNFATLPDDLGPTARAYAELVKDKGLSFTHPDMITFDGSVHPDAWMRERFVINTDTMTAGTFDHIGWRKEWDLPRLLDAKSSKDPEKYGHGFAIQMADYAYARYMLPIGWHHKTGTHLDYLPMPEVDKRWGAVIWIRDGQAKLLDVKLDAGWHAATVFIPTIKGWRARKDLVTPHDPARDRQPTPAEAVFVTGETSILEALLPAAVIENARLAEPLAIGVSVEDAVTWGGINTGRVVEPILPCTECINGDEDPAPWCDCRSGETCKGPCRNRAHDPSRHDPATCTLPGAEPLVFRSGAVELYQAPPGNATAPRMTVEPRPGRTPIPVNPQAHQGDVRRVPYIPAQRTEVPPERLIDTPPIISLDDPITEPEQVVRVDAGRAPVLAERAAAREREAKRAGIAIEIRHAKSRAELADIYNKHAADWWDGATELGNQLWPPATV